MKKLNSLIIGIAVAFLFINLVNSNDIDDDEGLLEDEGEIIEETDNSIDVGYSTPAHPKNAYFIETFDDVSSFDKKWITSQARKDNVEEAVAKYDGVWILQSLEKDSLERDLGLILKSKAKHAAISAPLIRPFTFREGKPLIVQYEINMQNGQECGGAYIKLLSQPKTGKLDLKNFNDKTPYSIMFGPDKCGNDFKFHFIMRHVNPLTDDIEEKHCKRPHLKFEEPFKDKNVHLYTLVVEPTNTFEIYLDHERINSGHLLEDFTPPINPAKEIEDPDDFKPSDWDERENIPDPEAVKPDDWDEDAPMQIVDQTTSKPKGWLDDEPELIPDPESIKPDDWDDEMDGDWEPPLVNNPLCDEAPGCGEWKPPMIDNPNYKGKWVAPTITNPNYKGKWSPRKIPNPDYFEDLQPFKMTPIGAVGLELWSMSSNIYFDNILITNDVKEARKFAAETFDLKVLKRDKGQKDYLKTLINYTNENPWMYAVYVLVAVVIVVIFYICCCNTKDKSEDEAALMKKTDEPTEDDPHDENEDEAGKEGENKGEEQEDAEDEEDEDDEEENTESEKEVDSSQESPKTSPRLRKARKE